MEASIDRPGAAAEGAGSTASHGAPGKSTRTSRIARRAEAGAGARDDNGVAAGAESAMASLGGGGDPLPTPTRDRFEGSLGADLGGVRVHTGAASASAAEAVGARAFTTGNDIHFAAGQYRPDDPYGMHLLAHEVAHTQQQGGAAAGAPQYKLEVSRPDDPAEHEADRAADAMVAGEPAWVSLIGGAPVGRMIQRDAKPDAKTDATKTAAPTDAGATAANDAAIDREFDIELRREAGGRLSRAFAQYLNAAQNVKAALKDKEAQPTLIETLLEVAVGALAPGLINLALKPLKAPLSSLAASAITKVIKDPTTQVTTYVKADDFITKLELDDGKAKAGFQALSKALKKDPAVGGDGKPMKVSALVDLLTKQFNVYVDGVDGALGGMKRDGILGVYAAFAPTVATQALYEAQIRDLVKQNEEIAHYVDTGDGYRRIVMFGAWGVTQPALIHHEPGGIAAGIKPHWRFDKWVEDDMIETAIAAAKGQTGGMETVYIDQPYKGGWNLPILGHVDNPKTEGQRILEVGSWGKMRLCYAKYWDDPKAEWISWVPAEEEELARVKAARMGGLKTVSESIFKKIPPRPADA